MPTSPHHSINLLHLEMKALCTKEVLYQSPCSELPIRRQDFHLPLFKNPELETIGTAFTHNLRVFACTIRCQHAETTAAQEVEIILSQKITY